MLFSWAGEVRAAPATTPTRDVQAWLLGGGDVQRPAVGYLSPQPVPAPTTFLRFAAKVEGVGVPTPVTVRLLANGKPLATLTFPKGNGTALALLVAPLAPFDGLDVQVDAALVVDDLATVTASAVAT